MLARKQGTDLHDERKRCVESNGWSVDPGQEKG